MLISFAVTCSFSHILPLVCHISSSLSCGNEVICMQNVSQERKEHCAQCASTRDSFSYVTMCTVCHSTHTRSNEVALHERKKKKTSDEHIKVALEKLKRKQNNNNNNTGRGHQTRWLRVVCVCGLLTENAQTIV